MSTIEQARKVSLRLKRAPLQNGSNFHSEVADTIDALLAELADMKAYAKHERSLGAEKWMHEALDLRDELASLKVQKPAAYGIRQITDDEGVEEWEDIRTSPDVAKEDADGMMETGRGEQYEVVPLYRTAGAQASVTCQIYGHVVGACVECNTHEEADQKAELDALRADVRRLTGVAFLASAERDELRMELAALKASPVSLQAANDVCTIDCLNGRVMRLMAELADERIRGLQLLADAKEWQQMVAERDAELEGWKADQKENLANQCNLQATINAQRNVLEQALEAMHQYTTNKLTVGQRYTNEGQQLLDAITAIQELLA